MKMPTINASAACRLGIAAYGFAIAAIAPVEWLTPSTKPYDSNIHGGAVGTRTYPTSPITFASRIVLRNFAKRSCRRTYMKRSVAQSTVNSEFQYVHAAAVNSRCDESAMRCAV